MKTLYLDLDGVMADFDRHHTSIFGPMPSGDFDDLHWAKIHAIPDFFRNLPLKSDALDLFYALPMVPVILTSCPRTGYQNVARQKRAWVREHLGDMVILPVIGGHNKPMFMHRPGDILIDDYGKNCRAWEAEGGIAIKHETAEQTLEKLHAVW